jgi:vWA-MoxR associated protein C-terminal domain/Trypsin-like peptidase domain
MHSRYSEHSAYSGYADYGGYGRFGAEPGDPDEAVHRARVTVRGEEAGPPYGAGVVIATGGYVLTCAHVLNAALGRDRMAVAEPTGAELDRVSLVLPESGQERYRPRLVSWAAPRAPGGRESWWDGDLALLQLPPQAPRVAPVALGEAPLGSKAWAWYATGDGRSAVDVVVQKALGPWLMLDPADSELAVEPGYSGGPLWSTATRTLAGLVVGTEPEVRRYYAISPAAVRAFLAEAGLGGAAEERDPRRAAAHRRLTEALEEVPAKRYTRGMERFTQELNLPRRRYGPAEAAEVALAHARGVPALRDAFTGQNGQGGQNGNGPEAYERALLDAAARACPGRLLAPADHAELCALLARVPLPALLAAARAAVPYLPLRAERLPDAAAFVGCLEDRAAEPGVMPPLLQVAEEVAALRAELREELCDWSRRVADRLRVRPGALEQVRAEAAARAGSRSAGRPVVRVRLWDRGRADAYTYEIRLYDSDDRALAEWSAEDVPSSREVLCRDLAAAVERLADFEESAGVEFLLEYGSFGLPLDRWTIPTRSLGPRYLGLDHFVVLRGQQPQPRGPWERRWRGRGAAGGVLLSDLDSAEDVLTEHPDAACVVAACPPDDIDAMVRLCRHYGVPVMLWHRQAGGREAARALPAMVTEDWPLNLREEVRRRRLKARGDDQHVGAHLALLWEDPRWDPRTAGLVEPGVRVTGGDA